MSKEISPFNDYLHQEYSHIAEAHFKTNEMMSTFFKHYLAIMTIPIVLTAYIVINETKPLQAKEIISYIRPYGGFLLLVISLVGLAVMLHIINLRLDSLLYARAVNGIRKFFYDGADIDLNIKLRMRTLPQTTLLPAYFESFYFLPIIFALALFNAFYFWAGSWIMLSYLANVQYIQSLLELRGLVINVSVAAIIGSFLFFVAHFVFYWAFARYRETRYLKSGIIGIDIDGVMNSHREHFCSLLAQKRGKIISPGQITHIPVHEADLGVSREDEMVVFNDARYWIDMPIENTTSSNLKKLRNIFKFKLFIFTHRPWPNVTTIDKNERKTVIASWRKDLGNYESVVFNALSKWPKAKLWISYLVNRFLIRFENGRLVKRLTILWLRYYGFDYDKLIIEKGNEDATDPKGHFRNRFQFSRKKRIRYFVEDDLEKAVKLSFICDVIFLIDHPYNALGKYEGTVIPSNIIRVKSWNEVYQHIRRLS
jgi:uncharacterized HAD superfamily protein